MTTITSRELNQDVSAAKRAARDGAVTITDRGEPAFVLMSIEEYRRLSERRSVAEILRMPEHCGDIDFEPESLADVPRAADL
ncbi:type II toxin-antitoxin system prevent-host-death family antitoxin [Corynebacterium sp. USCH3]|uniref:type II toxin-antitoxin system Phd/YefM family antitoxin n=1 Tax=Corynebacterium sp. USCH3 TaxID=3024840 RepID=UPI00309B9D99